MYFPTKRHSIKENQLGRLKKMLQLYDTHGKYKYFWHFVRMLKLVMLIGQTGHIISSAKHTDKLLEIAATYPVPVLAVFKFIALHYLEKEIEFLYKTIDEDFWDDDLINDKLREQLKFRFLLVNSVVLNHFFVASTFCVCYMLFPFEEVPEEQHRLPVLIWLPFDIYFFPVYQILYFLCIVNLSMSVIAHAIYDFFFIYVSQHICAQCQILAELIGNLSCGIMEDVDNLTKFHSKGFQRQVRERFVICCKHHNLLIKCCRILNKYSYWILVVQLFTSIATLVFALYGIRVEHDEWNKSLFMAGFTMACSVELVLYAVCSSDLKTQGLLLAKAAYSNQWYLFKGPIKRDLTIFIKNAQKPITITAADMKIIDNEVIVFVGQRVFSIITLLLSLREENSDN